MRCHTHPLAVLALSIAVAGALTACESEAGFAPSDTALADDSASAVVAEPELWLDAPGATIALGTPFEVRLEAVDTDDDIVDVSFSVEGVVEVDAFSESSGPVLALVALGEGTTVLTVTNADGLTATATLRASPIATMSIVATTNAFGEDGPVLTELAPDGVTVLPGDVISYGARAYDDDGAYMLVDYRALWFVATGEERVDVTFPLQTNWITVEALDAEGLVVLDCAGATVEVFVSPSPEPWELRLWAWDLELGYDAETSGLSGTSPITVGPILSHLGAAAYDAEGRLVVDPDLTFEWEVADESMLTLVASIDAADAVALPKVDGQTQVTVAYHDLSVTVDVEVDAAQ